MDPADLAATTGSTVASALAMTSAFAPQVLLGAVAGMFADRWDRNGLAMLVWLKEEPGEPGIDGTGTQGEPALVAAEG